MKALIKNIYVQRAVKVLDDYNAQAYKITPAPKFVMSAVGVLVGLAFDAIKPGVASN